jgi:hypothetical protein
MAVASPKIAALKQREAELLAQTPPEHQMAGSKVPLGKVFGTESKPLDKSDEQRDPSRATRAQAMAVVELCKELGIDAAKLKAICQKAGSETVSGLKREVCQVLIDKLLAKKKAAVTSGN